MAVDFVTGTAKATVKAVRVTASNINELAGLSLSRLVTDYSDGGKQYIEGKHGRSKLDGSAGIGDWIKIKTEAIAVYQYDVLSNEEFNTRWSV